MKKILLYCEFVALATVLGATAVLTYDLGMNIGYCIIPFESRLWIRIPEVALGIFSIPFIINIIKDKMGKK